MSEEKATYVTEADDALEMFGAGYKAAVIERPRKVNGINDGGLEEFQLSGWVKMSAKFCAHIKKLKGAKLSIWLCLALNIDENGECSLTQKELCAMVNYSHTEVIDSVRELDDMGYLSVDRSGKKNLYKPVFVAKGKANNPAKNALVKKLDSTQADSVESSFLSKNSVPTSIKKKKEKEVATPPASIQPKTKATDFPAVMLYKAVTEAYPAKACWDAVTEDVAKINARLGRDVTKDDLLPFYVFWCGKGWNPKSIDWLEYAIKGSTEYVKPTTSQQRPAAASRSFPKYVNGKAVFENA